MVSASEERNALVVTQRFIKEILQILVVGKQRKLSFRLETAIGFNNIRIFVFQRKINKLDKKGVRLIFRISSQALMYYRLSELKHLNNACCILEQILVSKQTEV